MWTIPKFAAATVAEELSTTGKAVPRKAVENNTQSNSGIEDLFKDSPSLAIPSVSEKPQKDVKNDIMSLFEKVCTFGIFYASFEHFLWNLFGHLSYPGCAFQILDHICYLCKNQL